VDRLLRRRCHQIFAESANISGKAGLLPTPRGQRVPPTHAHPGVAFCSCANVSSCFTSLISSNRSGAEQRVEQITGCTRDPAPVWIGAPFVKTSQFFANRHMVIL